MQEMTEKTTAPLPEGSDLVRPFDVVTVYSTGSTPHSAKGEPMEVHPLLAKKLIDLGKATKSKPKEKDDK